jgi:hemoglobin
MKPDILTREDIELIMTQFYEKALIDDLIGHIFTKISPIHFETHLPIICDFWETILLYNRKYSRSMMQAHLDLDKKYPLQDIHFYRWVEIFSGVIDTYFEGETAERAKHVANTNVPIMLAKIEWMRK